jgi:colanic acid biosynthesis glycosyl transferase WcaI
VEEVLTRAGTMRLLIVSQYFWPENFRINDLVVELVRRGHQVTVLTGRPNYPDGTVYPDFRKNPSAFDQFNGAQVVRIPMTGRGRGGMRLLLNYATFALSASVLGPWKLRGCHFDAIFAFEPSPITVGIPAAVMRAFKKIPLAFWVLDLWPETLQAVGVVKSKVVLGMVGQLVRLIYRRCDLILAQSRSFIPQIRKYAGPTARVEFFPSWADTVLGLSDDTPAGEVPIKPGCFNVMFAGNIGDAQDFPAILNAAERLKSQPGLRWLIVGDGRMAAWVKSEIARRNLQESVVMLGRFSVERMPSFFRHADALLVSLKDERIFSMTIPGKLQSYLAAGIPVIAMLNGEGADVVRLSRSGLTCAAGDDAGLAAAVSQMLAMDREELSAMGRNGLAVSAKEFDRDTLISRLESWLVELKRNDKPNLLPKGGR